MAISLSPKNREFQFAGLVITPSITMRCHRAPHIPAPGAPIGRKHESQLSGTARSSIGGRRPEGFEREKRGWGNGGEEGGLVAGLPTNRHNTQSSGRIPSLARVLAAQHHSDATLVPWSWGEASTLCPAKPIPPEPSWPFGAGLSGPGLFWGAHPWPLLRPDST